MRFAADKEALLTAFERVSRIVKSNPRSVPILLCVKVENYGDKVYVIATSSMASVRVRIKDAVLAEAGIFVVDFERFKDRVSKASTQVVIDSDATSMRIISSDDQRLGLKLDDPREFPEVTWVLADEQYGIPKGKLLELFRTAHSVTNAVTSLTPAFLQIQLKEQKMWVASGVAYHVHDVVCNPSLSSSIPTPTLFSVIGFINESEGDTIWMSQDDDDVVITVGDDQFQTAPLAIPFPDLEPLFEKVRISTPSSIGVNRKNLLTELSKARSSAGKHGEVTLTLEGQGVAKIKISATSDIGDWYESSVDCIWTGEANRKLVFNLDSLVKFLQSFKENEINLNIGEDFKQDLSPIYSTEEGHSGVVNQFRI